MGHLKDIANQPKLQTFPNAQFEIAGTVPPSQCSEAKIESDTGAIPPGLTVIIDNGKFVGWQLVGKKVTVTFPPPVARTYDIQFNNDDLLGIFPLAAQPADPVTYYVHNGGELILTRDVQSFAQFIHAAGYAYTIKGGKLYTNIPSAQLQHACTILFDPLT